MPVGEQQAPVGVPAVEATPHRAPRRLSGRQRAKAHVVDRYRSWAIGRRLPAFPYTTTVPLKDAEDVLLLCSGMADRVHNQTYAQELAFACEMAARERPFAVTDNPGQVFGKRVAWFIPGTFVRPQLWDYSRQTHEFALGLEAQGNELFCSAAETRYWENKAHMHRRFDEVGLATPPTVILTPDDWRNQAFDLAPVLVKEEHSAGSLGIHYFAEAPDAWAWVSRHAFRPGESLIMQEVVPGATRDLRVTMVGARVIPGATYWRIKSPEAIASPQWTPTATKYNTQVRHDGIPSSVEPLLAGYLRDLGLRTAGVDLIWSDDDTSRPPLVLELSPYYQPNPPKPARYGNLSYKQFKARPYRKDGYATCQFHVFREIAAALLDQGLF